MKNTLLKFIAALACMSGSAWDRDKASLNKSIAEARKRYQALIEAASALK
ncbi:MAG: hypothetical protein ACKOAM_08090 [Chakrabartia sp.]